MKSIADEIITMEQRAQEMVSEAQKRRAASIDSIEDECLKIDKDILSRKSARIKKMINDEQTSMNEKISALNAETEQKSKGLTDRYTQNKDVWTEEIYKSILAAVGGEE